MQEVFFLYNLMSHNFDLFDVSQWHISHANWSFGLINNLYLPDEF
jgi:hypothetical protein